MLRSIRFSSLAETRPPFREKSFTSAAIFTGYSVVSNARTKSTPLRPSTAARQVASTEFPSGVTAPIPVMTTLRIH